MTFKKQTYIIAEAGVNHNGSPELAREMVDAAVEARADAIKFQTFSTEQMVTLMAPKAQYQKNNTQDDDSQYYMLKTLELSREVYIALKAYCEKKHIAFLSTPFDIPSASFLIDELKLPAVKIASGDITNAPLLLHIATKRCKVILSTGMANLSEIEHALSVLCFGYARSLERPSMSAFINSYRNIELRDALKQYVSLLHCTSEYPAKIENVNLSAMDTMAQAFQLPVGLSDHTKGIAIPIAACAKGATIIEKHFTLDKSLKGPDHLVSLDPTELAKMISAIRQVDLALGDGVKVASVDETLNQDCARKSIVAHRDIKQGELFTRCNITCKRPGNGVSPYSYWDYLNMTARQDYQPGDSIK